MGKQQVWFLTTCVFLFFSLASPINSTSQRQLQTISGVNKKTPKENDLIKKFPGQPPVNFKQYGGYVTVDESVGRNLYYYFVEAINANASTPLVLWLNGGPGCSSLGGAFTEHGPFRVHSDGKTLYKNPYTWINEANMLYLESPALVGFSYTNDPAEEYKSKLYKDGDTMVAEDNYAFIVKWLEKFPEYKGRDFYVMGQSYTGHYGPQLSQLIIQRNNQTFINLRGLMIGNPTLDRTEEDKGFDEFYVDHGIFHPETLSRQKEICAFTTKTDGQKRKPECFDAIADIMDLKDSVDEYNIYVPLCIKPNLTKGPTEHTTVLRSEPCKSFYMTAFLNRADVQEAMHANTTKLSYAWSQCTGMHENWSKDERYSSMLPILSELMGAGVRVLVYSGDADAAVPYTSTKYVIKKFNQPVENKWHPWFSEGQIGGFVVEYKTNFTFVTVKGAGHSVPTDKPVAALTLFASFIRNTPLPNISPKAPLPAH